MSHAEQDTTTDGVEQEGQQVAAEPMETEEEQQEQEQLSELANGVDYKSWNGVDIIPSLCMSCGETGETRLMLHKIPYFRELIIASFFCGECGERNNEVTFGGEIQPQGCVYELSVTRAKDLDRQVIKSDSASLRIAELDFEIPPLTQKGEISTIEGVLKTAAKNLSHMQPLRLIQTPEVGQKVAEIIDALTAMADGESLPFTILLDDPAGNSFIENPFVPLPDARMKTRHYARSAAQDIALGLDPTTSAFKDKDDKDNDLRDLITGEKTFGAAPAAGASTEVVSGAAVTHTTQTGEGEEEEEHVQLGRSEAIAIPASCPSCGHPGETLTALTDIPHFKEVIIMAFDCKACGFRTNEVKGGGAVPTYGTEVQLRVMCEEDLKRDLLKSDTAALSIPELELELEHGTLGGVFTTVEGMLRKIHQNLLDSNPFAVGDSTDKHHSSDTTLSATKLRFTHFLDSLMDYANGKVFPFSLILRDPLGNSFISAPLGTFLPPEADASLKITDFERNFEENEEFGLNDMNTKDFETGQLDEALQGPILPDRLTHIVPRGVDHPTPFAMGTGDHDSTPGGIFFQAQSSAQSGAQGSAEEDDAPQFMQPPAGWSVEKLSDHEIHPSTTAASAAAAAPAPVISNKRQIDDDSELDYIPYEEFSGRREGYVFRLGSKGIGYYTDKRQKQ